MAEKQMLTDYNNSDNWYKTSGEFFVHSKSTVTNKQMTNEDDKIPSNMVNSSCVSYSDRSRTQLNTSDVIEGSHSIPRKHLSSSIFVDVKQEQPIIDVPIQYSNDWNRMTSSNRKQYHQISDQVASPIYHRIPINTSNISQKHTQLYSNKYSSNKEYIKRNTIDRNQKENHEFRESRRDYLNQKENEDAWKKPNLRNSSVPSMHYSTKLRKRSQHNQHHNHCCHKCHNRNCDKKILKSHSTTRAEYPVMTPTVLLGTQLPINFVCPCCQISYTNTCMHMQNPPVPEFYTMPRNSFKLNNNYTYNENPRSRPMYTPMQRTAKYSCVCCPSGNHRHRNISQHDSIFNFEQPPSFSDNYIARNYNKRQQHMMSPILPDQKMPVYPSEKENTKSFDVYDAQNMNMQSNVYVNEHIIPVQKGWHSPNTDIDNHFNMSQQNTTSFVNKTQMKDDRWKYGSFNLLNPDIYNNEDYLTIEKSDENDFKSCPDQERVREILKDSLQNGDSADYVATTIGKKMEDEFGQQWQVVAGMEPYGSNVSCKGANIMHFKMFNWYFLLWLNT